MSTIHPLKIDLLKIPGARKFQAKDGSWHLAIPHPSIFIGEKGAYLDCDLTERREIDDYKNTHNISMAQTKEARQAKDPKVYIGNGKTLTFGTSSAPSTAPRQAPQGHVETDDNEDDIPF
jgi:flavin reductase (DIM6/NTAB) family NADH-FMN oxidoreductase RutF